MWVREEAGGAWQVQEKSCPAHLAAFRCLIRLFSLAQVTRQTVVTAMSMHRKSSEKEDRGRSRSLAVRQAARMPPQPQAKDPPRNTPGGCSSGSEG